MRHATRQPRPLPQHARDPMPCLSLLVILGPPDWTLACFSFFSPASRLRVFWNTRDTPEAVQQRQHVRHRAQHIREKGKSSHSFAYNHTFPRSRLCKDDSHPTTHASPDGLSSAGLSARVSLSRPKVANARNGVLQPLASQSWAAGCIRCMEEGVLPVHSESLRQRLLRDQYTQFSTHDHDWGGKFAAVGDSVACH